ITEGNDIFKTEAKTLAKFHIPINKLLEKAFRGSYQPIAAKCIYTQDKQGFTLATVTHGLDLKHCLHVLRKIAQYHACSVVLRQQEPSRFKTFLDYYFENKEHSGMNAYFQNTVKSVKREAEKWSGYEKCVDSLTALESETFGRWINSVLRQEDGYNVLIHGDLWLNNIMFRYSDENDVQEVRFVDFQLSYVTSPAIDLLYFLHSSASPEVLANDREILIDEYYNTLCDTFYKLGHGELQPTRDILNAELEKKQVFGVLACLTLRSFALVDRNHLPELDKLTKKDESSHFSKQYKEALKQLLPLYEEWGWLKV
ncbi:hypothetical protein L9F63_027396, partial [Diploptera punctata]